MAAVSLVDSARCQVSKLQKPGERTLDEVCCQLLGVAIPAQMASPITTPIPTVTPIPTPTATPTPKATPAPTPAPTPTATPRRRLICAF